jgi:hypothetical protein
LVAPSVPPAPPIFSFFCQLLGDDAPNDVGRAAGREGHDQRHRLGRPVLRLRWACNERQAQQGADQKNVTKDARKAHRSIPLMNRIET